MTVPVRSDSAVAALAAGVTATPAPSLKPRELTVLRLLATGRDRREAGACLGIGLSAVHKHLDSVYRTLDTGGLIESYHRLGWLVPR